MSPEDNEPVEAPVPPVPPVGEPAEAAVELALDEALSGEPVTEDGEPEEPLAEAASAKSADAVPVGDAVAEEDSVTEGISVDSMGTAAVEDSVAEEISAEGTAEPTPGADDPASDLVATGDADSLPDLTSDEALEAALEALLLIVDSPASEELLADTLGQPKPRIVVALRTMAQKFTERASGIDLRRVGEGWRFYTRDVHAPFVEKLLLDGQRSKLTRAALESLAVIAYRQPVTRARVAAVRGVNVDGVIRTLLARGLIEEMGSDPETTGTLYVTTELFLERLGLSSLNDLPAIAPLLPEVDTIDDIQ
ncbi:SMC-Scp complex subunit ScpB [Amycolatopsis sp. cmx-4-68]|uniref:SMC-Scp complex subunit ScpB n=1 Tax=Amycolatopsis sp. cmx-4-68 TaxID=2790938 RepID=UPI00397E75C2